VDSSVKYDKLLQSCSVKAIDLESVTTKGTEMTDFAPETVAPELVAQLTGGAIGTVGSRDKDIKINPQSAVLASQASDVFSLGLCYVELASRTEVGSVLGTAVGKSFARVNRYVDGNDDLGLSGIPDTRVKQLLAKMLEVDPSKRPSMLEVQLRLKLL
jgi:serine/threonine protein kinase